MKIEPLFFHPFFLFSSNAHILPFFSKQDTFTGLEPQTTYIYTHPPTQPLELTSIGCSPTFDEKKSLSDGKINELEQQVYRNWCQCIKTRSRQLRKLKIIKKLYLNHTNRTSVPESFFRFFPLDTAKYINVLKKGSSILYKAYSYETKKRRLIIGVLMIKNS